MITLSLSSPYFVVFNQVAPSSLYIFPSFSSIFRHFSILPDFLIAFSLVHTSNSTLKSFKSFFIGVIAELLNFDYGLFGIAIIFMFYLFYF